MVGGILFFLTYHRSFIAISRAVDNHDGNDGTAPDPMGWSAGVLPKRRRIVHAVRNLAMLPGPPALWLGEWVAGQSVTLDADDVAQWPYTPGLLVEWVSFLGSLHWPVHDGDLGMGGISYVELLIFYELWAGERLVLEKAHPPYLRPGRPISVSAVPFGPGMDIWRSCRLIGAMIRSLCMLPGGGANHCRLRHVGWERCSHGLELSWISSCSYSKILLGLPVRCLLGHFLSGTVLQGLLVEFLFGLYQFLVMLLG